MPTYPNWVGADHADDIQYVFGKPFATPLGYRAQDRTVSKYLIAYWTNFAKTGDPNMGNSAIPTHWAPYSPENGNYLEINKKMDANSLKQNLRTNYLRFWSLTYQALPTVAGEDNIPENKVPEDSVPENKVPEDSVPENKVPEDNVPVPPATDSE
ncbi:bile salt-activated lipase-like [Macrotis lagotis]|uniref:bile salt-activated lipase-like n=1 Tax=Macrotis lagotis TaxID=92651 RepID=UPI003D699B54